MKRTLLVLAILALGGGCGGGCDTPGTITFYWQFVGANVTGTPRVVGTFDVDPATTPNPNDSCFVNGVRFVDTIRITIDGTVEEVPCAGPNQVPGARLPGFLRGNHDWRIDGLRGQGSSGVVLFTQSGTTSARTCSDAPVQVQLQAVTPADLVVYYDVNSQPPSSCRVGGVAIANVPFELRNAANQIADTTCASYAGQPDCSIEGTNACDPASLGFTSSVALPLAGYTMNYLELWDAGTVRTRVPLARICGAPVIHDGFPVFLNLTAPAAALCPTTPAAP